MGQVISNISYNKLSNLFFRQTKFFVISGGVIFQGTLWTLSQVIAKTWGKRSTTKILYATWHKRCAFGQYEQFVRFSCYKFYYFFIVKSAILTPKVG